MSTTSTKQASKETLESIITSYIIDLASAKTKQEIKDLSEKLYLQPYNIVTAVLYHLELHNYKTYIQTKRCLEHINYENY